MRNSPTVASFGLAWALVAITAPGAFAAIDSVDSTGPAEEAVLSAGIPREEVEAPSSPGAPLAVFAAVERAWARGQVDSLVASLDPEERVHLAFAKGGPRGGYFNRDQAYFLFKDLFAFTKTDRFEFQKYWNLDEGGRSPYAVAAREFRMNDGATHTDQVYIALRRRGNQWVVGEIRSIDP